LQDIAPGTIKLIALIETARGVVNLREIAQADPRLVALMFGAEDLAGDIGAERTEEGREVFYAKSAVVIHAAACGLQAIDTPYVNFQDLQGLRAEALASMRMGYSGKLAIHPDQVGPIVQVFTPTPEQVRRARQLIDAHDAYQANRAGVFAFEGRMVDMPMIRAAEHVLARARAAGLLKE
jgi:citrate lyase beta subunit